MSLANCVHTQNKITSFEQFCQAISDYIDVPGQTLVNELFTDEEFEAVAQLNDAFNWPDESNWINWREGLRQIFFYGQLKESQIEILEQQNLEWLLGAPFFLHISNDDPSQVAYLPEREDFREQDRMQRGRIGRFFTNHLDMDDQVLVKELTGAFNTGNYNYILSRDSDVFERVYVYGPNSCMSGRGRFNTDVHPAQVYGSGDFAILASYEGELTEHTKFNGRCVIDIAAKQYLRIYGNNDSISALLEALSITDARSDTNMEIRRSSFDCLWGGNFARLRKITSRNATIMPYIDVNGAAIADPLSPQRGPDARWRLISSGKTNQLSEDGLYYPAQIMAANIRNTTGRTRAMRVTRPTALGTVWPEQILNKFREHDALVATNWSQIAHRFALETETIDETQRVIRPILWNSRPKIKQYTCGFCRKPHTINPTRSNVAVLLEHDLPLIHINHYEEPFMIKVHELTDEFVPEFGSHVVKDNQVVVNLDKLVDTEWIREFGHNVFYINHLFDKSTTGSSTFDRVLNSEDVTMTQFRHSIYNEMLLYVPESDKVKAAKESINIYAKSMHQIYTDFFNAMRNLRNYYGQSDNVVDAYRTFVSRYFGLSTSNRINPYFRQIASPIEHARHCLMTQREYVRPVFLMYALLMFINYFPFADALESPQQEAA